MTQPRYCAKMIHPEIWQPPVPADYCENDAEPFSDYCLDHLHYDDRFWDSDPADFDWGDDDVQG